MIEMLEKHEVFMALGFNWQSAVALAHNDNSYAWSCAVFYDEWK